MRVAKFAAANRRCLPVVQRLEGRTMLSVSPAAATTSAYYKDILATPGLVAYFPLDASVQANSVVGGFKGTLVGKAKIGAAGQGAPIAGDPSNAALALDGKGSYVSTNFGPQQTFANGAASYIAWVNFATTPALANRFFEIVSKSQSGNDLDLQAQTDNTIHFYTDSGSSTSFKPKSLAPGWHMLVATFDQNVGAQSRRLYWDGALVANDHYTGKHTAGGNDLSIGESLVFNGRYFQGSIDEVSVFNKSLTQQQVTTLFQATKVVPPKPATFSGVVFNDANNNGKLDTGEKDLAGWMVYIDTNNNGQFDPGEASTLTDANGKFSLTLQPGKTYVISVQIRRGFSQTSPTALAYTITVTNGGTFINENFGVRAAAL